MSLAICPPVLREVTEIFARWLRGAKVSPVAECGQTPGIVSRPCGQELLRWNPYPSVCRSSTHRQPSGSRATVHAVPNAEAIDCPTVCKAPCDNSAGIGSPFVVCACDQRF